MSPQTFLIRKALRRQRPAGCLSHTPTSSADRKFQAPTPPPHRGGHMANAAQGHTRTPQSSSSAPCPAHLHKAPGRSINHSLPLKAPPQKSRATGRPRHSPHQSRAREGAEQQVRRELPTQGNRTCGRLPRDYAMRTRIHSRHLPSTPMHWTLPFPWAPHGTPPTGVICRQQRVCLPLCQPSGPVAGEGVLPRPRGSRHQRARQQGSPSLL